MGKTLDWGSFAIVAGAVSILFALVLWVGRVGLKWWEKLFLVWLNLTIVWSLLGFIVGYENVYDWWLGDHYPYWLPTYKEFLEADRFSSQREAIYLWLHFNYFALATGPWIPFVIAVTIERDIREAVETRRCKRMLKEREADAKQ